jgi:putative membrane protein
VADIADTLSALDWRRPHPLTILVEIGQAIRSVLIAGAAIWFGLVGAGAGGGLSGSAFELLVVAAPLVAALARWYTTRYALDTESLHHHRGLIWRRRQVMPRANVQNVSTKAGILARLGSVVELQVSDASSSGDITIRFVAGDEADRLTALLRSSIQAAGETSPLEPAGERHPPPSSEPGSGLVAPAGPGPASPQHHWSPPPSQVAGSGPGPAGSPVERAPLVSPHLTALLRAEVTSVPVLLLGLWALVVAVAGPLLLWLAPPDLGLSSTARWLGLAGAIAIPLFFAAAQVVGRLLVVGGYRLTAEPDRFRIQVGLLTEARVAARRDRIQQIRVRRDLPHQWLGIERVEFETADVELNGTGGTSYLSPAGPAGHWRALATEAFGEVQVDEHDLQPVSPLTRRRILVRFAAGSLPLLALVIVHPALPVPLLAGSIVLGRWYSRRRYEVLGWAASGDQLLVRSGVVFGRLTLARLDKVQIVRTSSTIFQRRLNLLTLRISTAGHGFQGLVSLPDLPVLAGQQLHERLARRAAATPVTETL